MPAPDLTFQLLDGAQVAAHAAELQALHAEVYAGTPYRRDDAAAFAGRFRVQRASPASPGRGPPMAAIWSVWRPGCPLRPSTSWCKDLTTPPPEEVTAEHPGRTFALTDLLVRAS